MTSWDHMKNFGRKFPLPYATSSPTCVEHDASNEVVIMLFSEFGRRVRDMTGTGTDHGAAGVAFAIGDRVNGGMYGNLSVAETGGSHSGRPGAQL